LRAAEVLAHCEVVLHDRLVPEEVVRLARPTAEVRYVGKEGGVNTEVMKVQQDDISSQLVRLAREGRSVCRLKGGDPMIYGRVGEEMQELAVAGIPYEIVPAVTAAFSAAADARVPLTFRKVATSLRFLTMNATTTKDESFDWKQFVAPATTYALYMGLSALETVCKQLMTAGVPGERPMAVVDRASLPTMQVVAGTVETLPGLVKERTGPKLEGPALVLLGDVVGLRESLGASQQPPAPAASEGDDIALTRCLAALPAVSDEGLEALRARIEALLAARRSKKKEEGGLDDDGTGPAAKRQRPAEA